MATLKASRREGGGKYEAFRTRREGNIPGIVYGKSLAENIKVSVSLKEFSLLLRSAGRIVDLDVDGSPMHVLVKAVQHGVYEHELLHVDFRAVSAEEVIEVELEIELKGDAAGVAAGGMLEQNLHHVSVRCLPRNLPEKVSVDVSALRIGDIVYAGELPRMPGVEYVLHGNPAVASCRHPKGEEAPAASAAEGEAPAAPEVIGEKEREAKAKDKDK